MNHAYVRPGGLAQDFPDGWQDKVTDFVAVMRKRLPDYDKLLTGQPIWRQRLEDVGYLPLDGLPGARRDRPDPALRRAALGPAQGRARTAATRSTTSRSRPHRAPTAAGRLPACRSRDARVAQIIEQAAGEHGARVRSW
jgi:hypothetical protein